MNEDGLFLTCPHGDVAVLCCRQVAGAKLLLRYGKMAVWRLPNQVVATHDGFMMERFALTVEDTDSLPELITWVMACGSLNNQKALTAHG
jgi:hypothetical protein